MKITLHIREIVTYRYSTIYQDTNIDPDQECRRGMMGCQNTPHAAGVKSSFSLHVI